MIKSYVDKRLKDDNFFEIHTYWKTIKEKNDLDESRGLKAKENDLINDGVSVDCKKFNLGLMSTYYTFIWGALSYINESVATESIEHLSLLRTFMKFNENIPRCIINKLLKLHLSNIEIDSENISIHVNRKKAQDFA